MKLFSGLFGLLKGLFKPTQEIRALRDASIYGRAEGDEPEEDTAFEIHSLWDFLKFKENTQAFHLKGVIGFEEWVHMKEILRRIRELYGIDYKNDKSLYPYLKTMVDAGLFETIGIERQRKWRKNDLIIKLEKKKKKKAVETAAVESKEQQ